MNKRQLALLFLVNLCTWTVGNGLIPLLPVYATRLGAAPAVVGYYMAFTYAALAAGALTAGWVFEQVGRPRLLLIACGVLAFPIVFLMGRVTSVWQLAALNAGVWFLMAVGLALVSILASLQAGQGERGRVFGILAMSSGLGSLIGGLALGPIVDRWGYPTMFALASLLMLLQALAASLSGVAVRLPTRRGTAASAQPPVTLGAAFYLLFAAVVLCAIGAFVATLSRSLVMHERGFSNAAISSTGAVMGAVVIPLSFLMGWLSDRIGRKWVLTLCYAAMAAGLCLLTQAVALWHFWGAIALTGVLSSSNSVSSALSADLLPPAARARGMSRYSAAGWLGGIVGFAATGNAIQFLGATLTLLVGACVPVIAIILVAAIRRPAVKPEPAPEGLPGQAQDKLTAMYPVVAE